jgi:hypothetical protein
MLANDSNEGKNQSEFFLVIRPHQAVAELMAECPTCGAITSFALELALQAGRRVLQRAQPGHAPR